MAAKVATNAHVPTVRGQHQQRNQRTCVNMAASARAYAFKNTNLIGPNEYVTRGAVIKGLVEQTHKLSSLGINL